MGSTPFHLAIIPDGNRRWAKKNGIKASQLYASGTDRGFEASQQAFESGVTHLSLWGSSYANINDRSSNFFKMIDKLGRITLRSYF